MRRNIYYFEPLKKYDILSISIYLAISVFVLCFYNFTNSIEARKAILFGYTFSTSMFLYLFNYASLRNLSSYFIWLSISIVHFVFYFNLKDDSSLQNINGHASTGLRNIAILLVFYQILRFVNIKVQNQEFVAPSRGSRTDIIEGRRINMIDYISFVLYMILLFLLEFKF